MPTKIYWIHQFPNSAGIGIMPRPRGGDWLEDEVVHLKTNKVAVLVSLLERDEIHELDLEMEGDLCLAKGIEFINFPIPDRDIPKRDADVNQMIDALIQKLNEGLSVVIHCRMGIGRSSIIAGAVLLKYDFSAKDIIQNISALRGLQVPDTAEQLKWLKKLR